MSFTPFEILTADELNGLIPPGVTTMYLGATAPAGWLLLNGSAVSRSEYASLFAICGTAYGAGDGSTTFNLPDLRQRFPLGKAASGTGATLGATGGAIDHTHGLSINHTHPISGLAHTHGLDTASSHARMTMNTAAPHLRGQRKAVTSWAETHEVTATSGVTGSTASANGIALGGDSGSASPAPPTATDATNPAAATGTGNPPFVTVNFIVKV